MRVARMPKPVYLLRYYNNDNDPTHPDIYVIDINTNNIIRLRLSYPHQIYDNINIIFLL